MKLPRFTLRDLFWLVLVVAMACAWWSHSTSQQIEYERLEARIGCWPNGPGQDLHITGHADGSVSGVFSCEGKLVYITYPGFYAD